MTSLSSSSTRTRTSSTPSLSASATSPTMSNPVLPSSAIVFPSQPVAPSSPSPPSLPTGGPGGGSFGGNGVNNGGGGGITSSASLYRRSLSPLSTSPSLIGASSLSPSSTLTSSQSYTPTPSHTPVAATNLSNTNATSSNPLPSPPIVYTFLATLVLLLSVSAAIVVRSYVLRRRHRAMIEQAIRDGTWVPPAPPAHGGGRQKVDLSKKPKLYEAYLSEKGGWSVKAEEGAAWDEIRPVMAAYVGKEKENSDAVSAAPAPRTTAAPVPQPIPIPTPQELPTPRRPLFSRIARAFSPTSSSPTSPLPPPVTSSLAAIPLSTLPNTAPSSSEKQPESHEVDRGRVRLAVLIAMPSPAASHRRSMSIPENKEEETEPLPHLEMGVAELPLKGYGEEEEEEEERGLAREGRKGSMVSEGSV